MSDHSGPFPNISIDADLHNLADVVAQTVVTTNTIDVSNFEAFQVRVGAEQDGTEEKDDIPAV